MRTIVIVAVSMALAVTAIPAAADDAESTSLEDWKKPIGGHFARGLSNATYTMLALTVGNYMIGDSYEKETGKRLMDSLLVAGAGTQLLKATIDDRRPVPHSVNKRGFPSGHASLAFAAATVVGDRDEDMEIPAYTLAALIGWSRHQTRQHHWDQIIAGALLGCWAGRQASAGKIHLLSDRDPTDPESFCFTGFDKSTDIGVPWVLYSTEF